MAGTGENCKEEIPPTVIRTLHVELPFFIHSHLMMTLMGQNMWYSEETNIV